MSGRGASGPVLAELGKSLNRPVHLLEADFAPFLYMCDAAIDITWNGNVYLASQFLTFSSIAETSELLVNTCTVSLAGVDQQVVALLLQETYLNRRLRIRTAMLDDSLGVVGDPVLIFDGRMDRPTIAIDPDNGAIVCSVEGVSHWTDFERRPGRHTNDAEQRSFFPDDAGFSQVASLPSQVFWGIRQRIGPNDRKNYRKVSGN